MVVSCRKIICFTIITVITFLVTSAGFTDVRPLTDEEMDEIVAANLPAEIAELLPPEITPVNVKKIIDQLTEQIDSLLDGDMGGYSAIANIIAVNSNVYVQSNFNFFLNSESVGVNQLNVLDAARFVIE